MSQYVRGRGFAPDPRLVSIGKMTMEEYRKAHEDFYSKPLREERVSLPGAWKGTGFGDRMKIEFDKRSEPWTHWNEFPEERVGMGTSYINRQLESGQSIEDIKQNAADKNWIVGPDALDKFYGLNDRQQYNLQLRDTHLQEDRSRRWDEATKWFEDKKASGWDPYVAQGHPPGQEPPGRRSGVNPTSGPTNVLKINRDKTNTSTNTTKKSKKQKDTYTQPTFANTLTL